MDNNLDSIAKLLKETMDSTMKNGMPDLMKQFKETQEKLNSMSNPIETKNIKINGINCVALLYSDGVKIVTPTPKEYYDNIGKKECWYNKYFKRK